MFKAKSFIRSPKSGLARYFIYSLIAHALIFLWLWITNTFTNIQPHRAPAVVALEATMLDPKMVEQEVGKLKALQNEEQKIKEQKLKELQRMEHELEKKKVFEEHALQNLQREKTQQLSEQAERNKLLAQKKQEIEQDLQAVKKQLEQEKENLNKQQQIAKELNRQRLEQEKITAQKIKEQIAQQKEQEEKKVKQLQAEKIRQELARQAAEQKRVAELKKKAELQAKQKQQALEKFRQELLAAQKADLQKQLQGEFSALAAQQQAERKKVDDEIARFEQIIISKIKRVWHSQPQFYGKNLSAVVELEFSPTGEVIAAELYQPSGDAALDLSIRTAMHKVKQVSVPEDPKVFNLVRTVHINFRPDDAEKMEQG